MANPIVEISRRALNGGGMHIKVLFLYLMESPIAVGTTGATITVKKRSELPAGVETYQLIDTDEIQAIDNGLMVFKEVMIECAKDEPLQEVLLKVQKHYEKGKIWVEQLRMLYSHTGKRYEALEATELEPVVLGL